MSCPVISEFRHFYYENENVAMAIDTEAAVVPLAVVNMVTD